LPEVPGEEVNIPVKEIQPTRYRKHTMKEVSQNPTAREAAHLLRGQKCYI
jgi:hypothetical protein